MNDLEKLTIDIEDMNRVLDGIRLDMPVFEIEKPSRPEQEASESFLVLEQRGLVRLSEETRQRELLRLAGRKKRKKYTRKPGTVHPKKKLRTKRLRAERRWNTDPVSCLTNSYGYWDLDRELWDRHVKPLWTDSQNLEVKRTARGTRSDPHTIWNIRIVNRKTGTVVYDGNSQLLYSLSCSEDTV
jgi:hypothetical protein